MGTERKLDEMTLQQVKACLDAEVRKLLSQKIILAWILRRNAREFSGMELPAIMDCIEGEPEIGTRPVNPGETNISVQDPAGPQITGMQNENTVPGEGKLYYDIIFYVKIPRKHDIIF